MMWNLLIICMDIFLCSAAAHRAPDIRSPLLPQLQVLSMEVSRPSSTTPRSPWDNPSPTILEQIFERGTRNHTAYDAGDYPNAEAAMDYFNRQNYSSNSCTHGYSYHDVFMETKDHKDRICMGKIPGLLNIDIIPMFVTCLFLKM